MNGRREGRKDVGEEKKGRHKELEIGKQVQID